MSFRITGTGSALPERVVTNDDLSQFLDTSDEWIFTRTGIRSRHICTTETLDDLAVAAARQALEAAGATPEELDLIVCSSNTPDHIMPGEACAIAELIGATCPAFDITAACAGFVFALDVAEGWFARGRAQKVLIVSAEKMSRMVDWTDRATCVLFGDGAAAAVVEPAAEGLLHLSLKTAPNMEVLHVPGVAGNSPYAAQEAQPNVLSMKGQRVFKFGVTTICDAVHEMCADASISPQDIDHFVFHQANERILAAATSRLGIDDGRVARTLETCGNISSACIPLTLDKLVRSGELTAGQTVALVGFGAGLDTGSALFRWA